MRPAYGRKTEKSKQHSFQRDKKIYTSNVEYVMVNITMDEIKDLYIS